MKRPEKPTERQGRSDVVEAAADHCTSGRAFCHGQRWRAVGAFLAPVSQVAPYLLPLVRTYNHIAQQTSLTIDELQQSHSHHIDSLA